MTKYFLMTGVLVLCSYSFAETPNRDSINHQPQAAAAAAQQAAAGAIAQRPFSTADCAFTFTSGAVDTFLKFCVTANGNVTVFETPQGHEHLAVGQDGEGYGICDFESAVSYNDYAEFGDSGNWGAPTVVSQNAKSVKIARSTSDGVWTLTQTFTEVPGTSPSVKIAMALANNSDVERTVLLLRYANVNADGVFLNDLAATSNSAFGWNQAGPGIRRNAFGMVLQGTPFKPDVDGPEGYTQTVPAGPQPCSPFANFASIPLTATDGSLAVIYQIGVPKRSTQTVTVSYKGL